MRVHVNKIFGPFQSQICWFKIQKYVLFCVAVKSLTIIRNYATISCFQGFEHTLCTVFQLWALSFHNQSRQSLFPAKSVLLLASKLSKILVLRGPRSAFESCLENWLDRTCKGVTEFMLLRFLQKDFFSENLSFQSTFHGTPAQANYCVNKQVE